MIKQIRTHRLSKVIASYLAIQLITTTIQPTQIFALTGGPSQPEFNSFTPIGTSDMVNLSSGDFNYNIPIMDVGGYPLNLAYDSGITMDQEASWVGLGWNLNVGQISRQLRGLPDDFNGDEITYENNLRNNFTAGVNTGIEFPIFGNDFLNLNLGIGMEYNNYNGISFNTSYGASFDISEQVSAGLNITSSSGGDATVTPTIGLSSKKEEKDGISHKAFSSNIGVPFNSMQGIKGINMSTSLQRVKTESFKLFGNDFSYGKKLEAGASGFLSFNDNLTYSPTNKLRFANANLTLQFALGLEFFGSEGPQGSITGFGSIQALRNTDKLRNVKGYGYSNSENASTINSVLDFNRENDGTVTTNTTMLPLVNQTYDLYSIQGQGIGGMFRPYRSQVGHVFDETISYNGIGGSASLELGPGLAVHFGGNAKVNPSFTRSGRWQDGTNPILNDFRIRNNEVSQDLNYEPVYYKAVGELTADTDPNYTNSAISEKNPIKIGIGGSEYVRRTESPYKVKTYQPNNTITYENRNIQKVKRTERNVRTQSIQMIEYSDVKRGGDGQIRINTLPDILNDETDFLVPDDHHVGTKILKPDGSTYVFGETAYNTKKVEATFALGGNNGNCETGLVTYSSNENSRNNSSGRDHYFNKIHTPAYAHTYLLSSVLSSDYEDLTNDGPTDDDLGAYTKFSYSNPLKYNWRVPFSQNLRRATYSQGLRTDGKDDKGNFVYGEKDLKYIDTIQTKTHIAIFELSDREDAVEAGGEDGGIGSARMQKLDRVSLYSKPEYLNDPQNAVAIKVAHFEYDYALCGDLPNNSGATINVNGTNINANKGKLTLKKVYFTYRDSNMGQFTPYQFNYPVEDPVLNPDYDIKAYDVWGNYKPMEGGCGVNDVVSTAEFPFVDQDDQEQQDKYASAWTMTSIDLPSGGKLELEYESDDYGYVQNKHAMQMFKVVGAGDDSAPTSLVGNKLYEGSDDFDYIYVKLEEETTSEEFKENYLRDIGQTDSNPMYFRFMLNMRGSSYDYVTGYALIKKNDSQVFDIGDGTGNSYASIRLKRVKKEGGIINSNQLVNPIAKAGWYFGRKNLNRQVNGLEAPESDEPGNLISLGQAFVSALGSVQTIFTGPNQYLRGKNVAQKFSTEKSWIRLYHPDDTKLGGGIRVKSLKLHDNWDVMTSNEGSANSDVYKNFYGQDYDYNNTDGSTSGVATFEPNGSKENPLIQPFYDKHEKLIAPKESNYTEKPVGQSLYPSPTVTYGRVVVSNLKREREYLDSNNDPVITTLKKHATGRVINEFYTTKDFPTITDFTDITPKVDITGILGSVLRVRTNKSLTYSQGFVVRTNDMNGKTKSQKVQTEGQSGNEYISQVEYKYSVNEDGSLNNELDVINSDGRLSSDVPIGVTYDMVNDFRNYYNSSTVMGVDGNLAAIFVFIGILPTPTLLPVLQHHEQELKTVTTTKVIHSVGILKEKIAYDLGSKVLTENLAWDGQTGDVLLTKTINEYGDHYFNFNYPANWYYGDMGPASNNLDTRGIISPNASGDDYNVINPLTNTIMTSAASNNFTLGDQLLVSKLVLEGLFVKVKTDRVWVASLNGSRLFLIDEEGAPYALNSINGIGIFKIHRSGYRNLQTASMASVTLQENPIVSGQITPQSDWVNLNVVNSSAIEYSDAWNSQCEFRLPNPNGVEVDDNGDITNLSAMEFNPYLYNVKGDWRAIKSYAYLTGRNNSEAQVDPRNEGFFNTYRPFYKRVGSNWAIDNPPNDEQNRWTYASEVTAYSPYGAELENKDALDRYSAAQYGYRYTLPTAVGSNTKYMELAFDGFEDYAFSPLNGDGTTAINPHFGYQDEVIENSNASITDQVSHSGRNSIRISPGSSAAITHRVIDCDDEGSNSLPNAENDSASNCNISPGKSIVINVLANDDFGNDGPGTPAVSIVSQPNFGSVQVNLNNTITYTVGLGGTNASDSFIYQICDSNGDCDTATVFVNCDANSLPTANNDFTNSYCSPRPGTTININVLANDTPGADGLATVGAVTIITQPNHGSVSVNSDNTISYVAGSTSGSSDSFTYQLCDSNGDCDTATVTLNCFIFDKN